MQQKPIQKYPVEDGAITHFDGEHFFLSNFSSGPVPILWNGLRGETVEHVFQAAKTRDPQQQSAILAAPAPGLAKRLGRRCSMRADWNDIRIDVMTQLVRTKFADPSLASKLLLTADRQLVEGNWWGDRFWGIDSRSGVGANHLGEILMQVRDELRG